MPFRSNMVGDNYSVKHGYGNFRIIVPVAVTIVLFTASFFVIILPRFERSIWDRRRETLRELVNTTWTTLQHFHSLEEQGLMSRETAQTAAKSLIRDERYGDEMKDYYWINDMEPSMIVHPYRPDLEDHSLTDFSDPSGKLLFVEFVRTVEKHGEGYVDYMWQWKDDPDHIVPKLSFVKLFEPWGWIVGTGMYIEDVEEDIAAMKQKLVTVSGSVLFIILILLGYVVHQNVSISRERFSAVESLKWSEKRFRELAELLPEIIYELDRDGKLIFTNRESFDITGYSKEEYERGINALDFFTPEDRERARKNIGKVLRGEQVPINEYRIVRKDGTTFPVLSRSLPILKEGEVVGVRGILIDITERERAEQEVRESEEKYRQLFEMESDAIFLLDSETYRILEVNKASTDLYGYTRKELVEKSYMDITNEPEKSSSFLKEHQKRIPVRYHRKKDGTVFPVEISMSNFKLRGCPVVVTAMRDITDRMEARNELENQRAFLKNVIDNAPNSIYVKDKQGCVILANRQYAELFGMTEEELLGCRTTDMIDDHSIAELLLNDDEAILLNGEERIEREHIFIDISGNHRWFYTIKIPLRNRDNEVEQLLGISSDITVLKKTEEALRKSEERFRAIFETAQDSIFIKDLDYRYTDINPAMEKLIGMPESMLTGKTDKELFNPETELKIREVEKRVFAGETVQEEYTLDVNKTTRTLNVIKVPMRDKSGTIIGLCGIARDITERKRLENQFYQSQKMESIGRLAGGIAHDFNNLLTVIIGNAELSLMSIPESDQLHSDIMDIKTNAERASNLTRQLLAFSRRQIIKPRIIDINTVVVDMNKMLHRLIGENIELVTILHDGLWTVNVDPGQIEQVLTNLIVNARDAILPGRGKITIETNNVVLDKKFAMTHGGVKPGDFIMLAITDNGVGMDEEIKAHIFEPFFTTKEKDKGTGLGLATCYGIVKQNNGTIWVYSEPNHGTTVKIYLPRVEGKTERPTTAEKLPDVSGGSEIILLVEDDYALHEMAVKILKKKGYVVLEAYDGEEAVRIAGLNKNNISLLITDVVMPRLGGMELAEKLMSDIPSLKVLYMSGYTDMTIITHGILKPGIEFLQKPFTPASLVQKVRQVLDK